MWVENANGEEIKDLIARNYSAVFTSFQVVHRISRNVGSCKPKEAEEVNVSMDTKREVIKLTTKKVHKMFDKSGCKFVNRKAETIKNFTIYYRHV